MKKFFEKIKCFYFQKKQKALILDFKSKKEEILERNSKNIIEGFLVPYIIADTYHRENWLMTERAAYKIALNMFLEAKEAGKIDCLNRLVTKD